jgi:hypothetical protein
VRLGKLVDEGVRRVGAIVPLVSAATDDPLIDVGARGTMRFSRLADFHRRFAAYHYRQIVDFLRSRGVESPSSAVEPDSLGLPLPSAIY